MSNNLGRNEVQVAQNQKEATINESDGILDAKLTEVLVSDFTGGAVTLTNDQWQQNAAVQCTNVGSALALNTPQQKGYLLVDNALGANEVTVTRGSGTVAVPAGENRFVYQDGTTNGLIEVAGGGGGTVTLTDFKDSVRVATTAAGTLATDFENGDTVDGTVLATNDRILLKDQADASENGIRVVQASGAPIRATDFDEDSEVTAGALIPVEEGTVNADGLFILTTNDPITVGVTNLTFQDPFTGGGASTFVSLTDTPNDFTGQAGKIPVVNSGETALEFINTGAFSGALVTRTSVQSIATATATAVNFDVETFDTGFHDNVTNNSRITIPTGVDKVILFAGVRFATNATGVRSLQIRKNGTDFVASHRQDATGSGRTDLTISTIQNVSATDYFEVIVEQDSGGNLDIQTGVPPYFACVVVDPPPGASSDGIFRGVRLRKSSNQTLTTAVAADLTWQTEDYDTNDFHDGVTNTERITVPAGISRMRFVAGVEFASNSTGRRSVEIIKNNTDTVARSSTDGVTGAATNVELSTGVIDVAENDFFEVSALQASGGNLDVVFAEQTFFNGEVVTSEVGVAGGGGGGGGQWTLVNSYEASGTPSQLDVPLPSASAIKLVAENIVPDTNTQQLYGRFTTDNFSTVEQGASDYDYGALYKSSSSASTNQANSQADSQMRFPPFTYDNSANLDGGFECVIRNANTTDFQTSVVGTSYRLLTSQIFAGMFSNLYQDTPVVNGIRFFFAAGNIGTLKVHVYTLNTAL